MRDIEEFNLSDFLEAIEDCIIPGEYDDSDDEINYESLGELCYDC